MAEHLTTAQAAQRAGVTPDRWRSEQTRSRQRGGPDLRRPGPDARTPLWDAAGVDAWVASRIGRWPRTHDSAPARP